MGTHGNHKSGGRYFWLSSVGSINDSAWLGDKIDKAKYAIGNCYKTREEAEQAVEILKIHTELKRYAEEHNEAEIDWTTEKQDKYYISNINLKNEHIEIDWNWRIKRPNQIYFTSHEIAEDAIKAIGEDRVKMWLKA